MIDTQINVYSMKRQLSGRCREEIKNKNSNKLIIK